MTKLKIQGKPASAAQQGLAPYVTTLYNSPSRRVMAVVELAHVERTQPAPDADSEASVTMRITQLEIPNAEQEGVIREAQRALYLIRTARGTLTEDGEMELSEQTLKLTGGLLTNIEVARLRAGLQHWVNYAHRVNTNDKLTITEIRHELDTITQGLMTTLTTADPSGEED